MDSVDLSVDVIKAVMEVAEDSGYKLPPEFQVDARDPLIELNISDSTEFWLIQWPKDQVPDFDGQEVSLDLLKDGHLGTFEGSSGKSYDMVSFAAQEPDATVFLSSASDSKIVGKIARRVSFVHYPEPSDFPKHHTNKLKQMYERSSATSLTNTVHNYATPIRSSRPQYLQSASGYRTSTHSSGHRSSLTGEEELSNASRRRNIDESTRSLDQSAKDSGRDHTAVTSPGHSQEKKSKRRKKNAD